MSMSQYSVEVHESLALVIRLSRIFGMAPLRLKSSSNTSMVHYSFAFDIYGRILHSCIFLFSSAYVMWNLLVVGSEEELHTGPVRMAFSLLIGITIILGTYSTFKGTRRMKELIENLNSIQKVFESLTLESINDDYKPKDIERRKVNLLKLFLAVVMSLLSFEIWITFETGVSTIATMNAVIRIMLYCFGYLTMCTLEMLFIFVVIEVQILLQMINQQLRILCIGMKQTNRNVNIAMRFVPKTIRHLTVMSSTLSDLISKLNIENGKLLITTLLVSVMYFELSGFLLIIGFTDKETSSLVVLGLAVLGLVVTGIVHAIEGGREVLVILDIFLRVTRTIFNLTSVILLMEPCQWIRTEVEVTKVLLNRIIYNVTSFGESLENELNIFYRLMHANKVCFSPLELFVLGRPLVFKILGAVISYLIIIFQFDVQA